MTNRIRTGDVLLIDFSNAIGHQQGGIRYAVVVSNNIGNINSPTIEVLPGTSKRTGSRMPTHAHFEAGEISGLPDGTTFEAESKWTVNKFQIKKKVAHLTDEQLDRIATAMLYATPIVIKAVANGIHNTERFKKISDFT